MAGELWDGADVRWIGEPVLRDGVHLRAGDHVVVVDAGRHHVRSFSALSLTTDGPADTGVVIRVASGSEFRIDPHDVELVAPDHPLKPEADAAVAEWWMSQLEPWGDILPIASFVPRSLDEVCLVLHPWTDETGGAVSWAHVAASAGLDGRAALAGLLITSIYGPGPAPDMPAVQEPREGQLDARTASALVEALGPATTTPDDVFFAIWVGWGDVPPARFPGAGHLATRSRGHFLLRGPIRGALSSVSAARRDDTPVSGIWWPADRAWLVHTEIDFHWTFVAGSPELIASLHRNPSLEILPVIHSSPANQIPDDARRQE